MRAFRRVLIYLSLSLLACATGLAQSSPDDQQQSLADAARKLRSKKPPEVQTTQEDAKKLFESVDEIFAFASKDSGFPKRSDIKRRLVSQADVEKYAREHMAKVEFSDNLRRSELTMKKFGLLPRDFELREFLVKSSVQEIAGYYDWETKSISLLNWVPLKQQEPILAHELTHALQDQNYNLKTWMAADETRKPDNHKDAPTAVGDEGTLVRRAVVEGQAMVVYVDYLLAPFGRTLENTPGVLDNMEEPAVRAVVDTELLHSAPMILREMGTFPYVSGLIFEGELLAKGGKAMAFAGTFARPPRSTHEVLQPRTYIESEKVPSVRLPQVEPLLAGKYEVFDSGNIGELDLRALLEQYGERKAAPQLSSDWRGAAYLTLQRKGPETATGVTTHDLALLFVSRWRTPQAAQHFATIYGNAIAQRYPKSTSVKGESCGGANCPVSASQFSTDEGPVIVEQWSDNTVIISESLDRVTAASLRDAVREQKTDLHARSYSQEELGLRLCEAPAFRELQLKVGQRLAWELRQRVQSLPALPAASAR